MGLDNPLHIAFLVVILLLVFGARRLPEIGRSLGAGMREFKDSVTGESKSSAGEHPPTLGAGEQPVAQPPPSATAAQPPQPPPQQQPPEPVVAQPGASSEPQRNPSDS